MIDLDIELPNAHPPPPKGALRELLTPLPEDGEYLLSIDNSTLEGYERCPTFTLYKFVYRRQAHARNASLTAGGAVHKAIELQLKGFSPEQQDAGIVQYFLDNPTALDEYRTPPYIMEVMRHYRERCAFPDYALTVLGDPPIIERGFELPLGVIDVNTEIRLPDWPEPRLVKRIHVAWSGKIDAVADIMYGHRIVDHKTTSIAGDYYFLQFPLSHQTIGYTWAARQLFPELGIKGVCINTIFMRKPLNGASSLTSKGPRGGEPALQFLRLFYDYSEERTREWVANCMMIIEDMVHCLVRNFYPMYTHHCVNKYGRCPYHDVCTLDTVPSRHRMLSSEQFEDVTWSPTAE
jgi:PD-(D/E)XK nuclease superfamily